MKSDRNTPDTKSGWRWILLGTVLAVVTALLALVYNLVRTPQKKGNSSTQAFVISNNAEQPNLTNSNTHFVTGLEHLPASLQGTTVDGELTVDDQGNLVINRRLKDLFDYFLTTRGEENISTIRQRVIAYVKYRLKEPAASQAQNLFERYVSYVDAGGQLQKKMDPAKADTATLMQTAWEELDKIRQRFFSRTEINGLFGDEKAYNSYQLARIKIANDARMDESQKAELLKREYERLPQSMKDSMGANLQYENLQSLTAQWKQKNGTPEELHQIREQLVGPEATRRLEGLDQEEQAWASKTSQYVASKAAIVADNSLSDSEKKQRLDRLLQQFTPEEKLRLPTYEQMAAKGLKYDDL